MLSSVEKWKLFHPPSTGCLAVKVKLTMNFPAFERLCLSLEIQMATLSLLLFFFNQLDKFSMCLHNDEEGKESKSSENLALPEDSLFFSFSVVYCRNCLFVLMSSTTFFFNSLVFISILRLFRFLFPAPHSDTIPISSQHSVFSALVSLVCYATFTISVSPSEQYICITEWEMAARNKNL